MGRRSALAAAGVALLACAACTGSEVSVEPQPVTTTDAAGRTTVVTPEPTAHATAPGDAGPTTPVPVPMAEVVLGQVAMGIPSDWEVAEMEGLARSWCLQPADPLGPAVDGCAGVLVSQGNPLPGPGGSAYRAGMADGWTVGPPAQPCPFEAAGGQGDDAQPGAPDDAALTTAPDVAEVTATPNPSEHNVLVTTTEGDSLTYVRTELAGMPATYETWRVSCSLTGETFAPQVWYVPDLELLVRDYLGQPQTVLVLESLERADEPG